jgi:hypothetical protein
MNTPYGPYGVAAGSAFSRRRSEVSYREGMTGSGTGIGRRYQARRTLKARLTEGALLRAPLMSASRPRSPDTEGFAHVHLNHARPRYVLWPEPEPEPERAGRPLIVLMHRWSYDGEANRTYVVTEEIGMGHGARHLAWTNPGHMHRGHDLRNVSLKFAREG